MKNHSSVLSTGIIAAIALEIKGNVGVSLNFICIWSKQTIVWFRA